jgi:hypothetical protein
MMSCGIATEFAMGNCDIARNLMRSIVLVNIYQQRVTGILVSPQNFFVKVRVYLKNGFPIPFIYW